MRRAGWGLAARKKEAEWKAGCATRSVSWGRGVAWILGLVSGIEIYSSGSGGARLRFCRRFERSDGCFVVERGFFVGEGVVVEVGFYGDLDLSPVGSETEGIIGAGTREAVGVRGK
ncbi:hypothetical protein BJ875DRAFT_439496 [Amylocarpus encephaloides]|uniref:Uncharacterized protein n=1 Tax=Amylocarpus encephaloides TaxID=45428 RepID=A0A9P8C8R9_9HELO|nr:hypothetical protein BJ875DRAFT_439496 [Amylocarpus encephaloides]